MLNYFAIQSHRREKNIVPNLFLQGATFLRTILPVRARLLVYLPTVPGVFTQI